MAKNTGNHADGPSAEKIRTEHRRRYKSLCPQMQTLLHEISEYCPDVNLFIEDSGNWNLLVGPSHDDLWDSQAISENVAVWSYVAQSSGGAW